MSKIIGALLLVLIILFGIWGIINEAREKRSESNGVAYVIFGLIILVGVIGLFNCFNINTNPTKEELATVSPHLSITNTSELEVDSCTPTIVTTHTPFPTTKIDLWECYVITNPYYHSDGRPKQYLTLWFDSKGEKQSISLEHIKVGTKIYPADKIENGFIPFYWTDNNNDTKIYWVLEKYCKLIIGG